MEAKRAASKKHAAAGAGDMEGFGWHLKLDKQKLPPTAMSQKINGGQSREGEGVDAAKDQSTAGEGEVDMFHLRAWHRKIQKKAYVSSFILKNVGWLSAAAVWCIGTWIILAYGVLIYTYLGAGEEKAFIYAWGMTFVVNNFGFESVAVIWRKVLFIKIVESMNKLLRYRTIVEWYESYIETIGSKMSGDEDDEEDYEENFNNGEGGNDDDVDF